MLVLSRRPQEKIAFPSLGISIEIVRVEGRTVRVGIEAPKSVPVFRQELLDSDPVPARDPGVGSAVKPGREAPMESETGGLVHQMRGRMNTATIGLFLAQKQIEIGDYEAAQKSIQDALLQFAALEAELSVGSKPAPDSATAPRRLNALLVEDNVNESALLVSYLKLSGFEVEAVSDGQAALDYLAGVAHPDVVLLDMRLPLRSGPEILKAIRRDPHHRDLKVFAVTGSSSTEFDIPSGPDGVDGWFSKPLNPIWMIEALKSTVLAN